MLPDEFKRGYDLLCASFNREPKEDRAKLIYQEHFSKLDGWMFLNACRKIAREDEKFPAVARILSAYRDQSVVQRPIQDDHRGEGCEKCEKGIVPFIRFMDGTPYRFIARCGNCEAGKKAYPKDLPTFEELYPDEETAPVRLVGAEGIKKEDEIWRKHREMRNEKDKEI